MTYQFNPHRHVKIWLSKDPDIFLNLENQLRLIRMRHINPTDEIHLVYDSSLLSDNAWADLIKFCEEHKIVAHDIQGEIIPACQSAEEEALITIYTDEIQNLDKGGNLGVASDVLRWLEPVYKLGTYSDFDTDIDTRQLPATIEVESSILLNASSISNKLLFKKYETASINNDIIAVVDSEAAKDLIKNIQQQIYQGCSRVENYNPFTSYINNYENNVKNELSEFRAIVQLMVSAPTLKPVRTLGDLAEGKTNRELRVELLKLTQNNQNFCEWKGVSIEGYATQLRNTLKQQTGFIGWLILPKTQFKKTKEMLAMSDEDLVTAARNNTRFTLLKNVVVHTSGPAKLTFHPFPNAIYSSLAAFNQAVLPMAFAQYGLDNAFKSKQSLPLHATPANFAKLSSANVGDYNDVSWLEEGQKLTRVRELKIKGATGTLQRFFKQQQAKKKETLPAELVQMRQLIEAHISKIQSDLNGCFGFYRNLARHKKIEALQGILSHFEHDQFDTKKFKMALNNYQSKEIFASFGKSKTKELIDRLTILSRQARAFSIANEDGVVELPRPGM